MKNEALMKIIADGLFLKVGSPLFLTHGVQRPVLGGRRNAYYGEVVRLTGAYGAPVVIDGRVYVPTAALEYHFGTKCEDIVTVTVTEKGGEREYEVAELYAAVEAYGAVAEYDNMGLIMIGASPLGLNREENLGDMMHIMKQFIYEYATPQEIYQDTKEHTNGFRHPYLYANEEKFDRLYEIYKAGRPEDSYIINIIEKDIATAEKDYRKYAKPLKGEGEDADYSEYVGMIPDMIPVNPHKTADGYDPDGGRLGVPVGPLAELALGYQYTRDIKYARLAYDYALAVGRWEHWGEGHFLNCADATFVFAIALDWLYNVYVELSKTEPYYNVATLEDICYEKGVKMGYLASLNEWCPHPSAKQGGSTNTGFVYRKKSNNWNAVCTAGMSVGAFAIMGRGDYRLESCAVISDGIYCLANYGLGQYAPDGSYIESPGYWSYGTNTLCNLIAAYVSAAGTDYGYMNTWGLDKTNYFAVHAESSDYRAWSYHDGGTGHITTYWFNFVAQYTGDYNLALIRRAQIEGGKPGGWRDLFYLPETTEGEIDLSLDYLMEGIDCFATRSGWEPGSLYVGFHGGKNKVPHGQLDAGSFVYHNMGKIWYPDLGSDRYTVYRYFGNTGLYRRNVEGNSVISIGGHDDTLPYGQTEDGYSKMIRTASSEGGSLAVLDQADVYRGFVDKAERGMLLTENRKVTVIQDEIDFKEPEYGYWVAHFDKNEIAGATLSEDGRVIYMTAEGKDGETLRVRTTLVSDDPSLRFEFTDCYDFLFASTCRPGDSEAHGCQPEAPRDNFTRILVRFSERKSLRMAVVIEACEDDAPVGYTWRDMSSWEA